MNERKEIKNYIKNNELDLEKIINEYSSYTATVINNMAKDNLNKEDKEEIISEVFCILWKNKKKLDYDKALSSYIAGITRNVVKEYLRTIKVNCNISEYENNLYSYDKIDDNEIRFNLTATGNEKTFPESKKLIIIFNKLRISKWIEDKNEETILSGNWNYEIDVPENMAKTNITNYKLKSISDENYKFEKAYCSNTAFKIYLNNCSGISWNEKDCVENSKGEKFYPAQRSDGDGEISTNVDGTVKFHNTYNLTNYDATDTLKVHIYKANGEEIIVELERDK